LLSEEVISMRRESNSNLALALGLGFFVVKDQKDIFAGLKDFSKEL